MSDRTPDADLDHIFRNTHSRLLVSMYALTGNMTEAQDVVAEAFVRAVSKRENILAADSPEAWLRTVARNIAVSRWKRAKHLALLLRRAAEPDPVVDGVSPDRVAVMAAIRRLPRPQAETVALHYIADLSVADIAVTLDVSEGTVKSRLSRGRTALGSLLADDLTKAGA
jgi:RNA polymerase sigma-70 factor (ECF subfamily)